MSEKQQSLHSRGHFRLLPSYSVDFQHLMYFEAMLTATNSPMSEGMKRSEVQYCYHLNGVLGLVMDVLWLLKLVGTKVSLKKQ